MRWDHGNVDGRRRGHHFDPSGSTPLLCLQVPHVRQGGWSPEDRAVKAVGIRHRHSAVHPVPGDQDLDRDMADSRGGELVRRVFTLEHISGRFSGRKGGLSAIACTGVAKSRQAVAKSLFGVSSAPRSS